VTNRKCVRPVPSPPSRVSPWKVVRNTEASVSERWRETRCSVTVLPSVCRIGALLFFVLFIVYSMCKNCCFTSLALWSENSKNISLFYSFLFFSPVVQTDELLGYSHRACLQPVRRHDFGVCPQRRLCVLLRHRRYCCTFVRCLRRSCLTFSAFDCHIAVFKLSDVRSMWTLWLMYRQITFFYSLFSSTQAQVTQTRASRSAPLARAPPTCSPCTCRMSSAIWPTSSQEWALSCRWSCLNKSESICMGWVFFQTSTVFCILLNWIRVIVLYKVGLFFGDCLESFLMCNV